MRCFPFAENKFTEGLWSALSGPGRRVRIGRKDTAVPWDAPLPGCSFSKQDKMGSLVLHENSPNVKILSDVLVLEQNY